MRILLVQPECETSEIGFRLAAMPEPLSLEMLAAAVPDHEVRILDMRLDRDLGRVLEKFRPEMVGLTALTPEVYAAHEVLQTVKDFSPEIFTVAGGHHASLIPSDFCLPQVDAIALGEGEVVFAALVEAVRDHRPLREVPNLMWRDPDGAFVRNERLAAIPDLNRLPLPRRDLTAPYRPEYFFLFDKPDTLVATSRGCPYRCNFCSVWEFYGGRTRQMIPERVIDHVRAVASNHITFVDDNFLMNASRDGRIADLILAAGIHKRFSMQCRTDSLARHPDLVRRWKEAGLYAVLLGLEGANDTTLQNVNKRNTASTNDEAIRILHDHGVIIWGCFIVDPQWSAEDFDRLRDYVSHNEITHTQFTVLTPLPGTELYRQRAGELLTRDYRCFDALHAVTPTRLPRIEFYQRFADLYRQTDPGPYYDLVGRGMLTIDDCRRGKHMLETMSRWELYLERDPVLGRLDRQPCPADANLRAAH